MTSLRFSQDEKGINWYLENWFIQFFKKMVINSWLCYWNVQNYKTKSESNGEINCFMKTITNNFIIGGFLNSKMKKSNWITKEKVNQDLNEIYSVLKKEHLFNLDQYYPEYLSNNWNIRLNYIRKNFLVVLSKSNSWNFPEIAELFSDLSILFYKQMLIYQKFSHFNDWLFKEFIKLENLSRFYMKNCLENWSELWQNLVLFAKSH